MTLMFTTLVAVMVNAIMATVAFIRYRTSRAGVLFILVIVTRILLSFSNVLREMAPSAAVALAGTHFRWTVVWLFALTMLLFLGALYAPARWQRPWIVRGIVGFYLLGAALFALDGMLGTRWVITRVDQIDGMYTRTIFGPLGWPLASAFNYSWVLHLAVLLRTFARQPAERRPLLVLLGCMIVSGSFGGIGRVVPSLSAVAPLVSDVLFGGALAYLLFRRRVFETTRVALDVALNNTTEGIAVVASDETILWTNRAVEQLLGLQTGHRLELVMAAGLDVVALRQTLRSSEPHYMLDTPERAISVTSSPILDHTAQLQGHLLLARDVTAARTAERELQHRQHTLEQIVAELQLAATTQNSLMETVRALSFPIIPVVDGVIVLPLVGLLDHERAADFEQRLLSGIQQHQAHTVILDVTGVPTIDQQMAAVFLRAVQGARLLGARTTLAGMQPNIAQAIVASGINLQQVGTAPSLQAALAGRLDRPARTAAVRRS